MIDFLAFYGALIFGFGFGMVALYRIGCVGWTQFAYWLGGLGAAGSSSLAALFGPAISKLWLVLGVPSFALDRYLMGSGREYSPPWLADIGLDGGAERAAMIVGGYVVAYGIGRAVGSRQRDFNKARLLYEGVVASKGYWFDHRTSPSHYEDPAVRNALTTSERLYARILEDLAQTGGVQVVKAQNQMTLHYQRALLYCTLGRHAAAREAIEKARRLKQLAPQTEWDPQEERIFESQLLFLEGEIALVEGRRDEARALLERSQAIDGSLGDDAGVSKNQERLDLV